MASQRYTMQQVADAIRQARGMLTVTADILNCEPGTVYRYLERYPQLRLVVTEARERMTDIAENALYRAIEDTQPWAVAMYLKSQGRSRGYGDQSQLEISGPGGGPIRLDVDRFLDALTVAEAGTVATSPATPSAATVDPD